MWKIESYRRVLWKNIPLATEATEGFRNDMPTLVIGPGKRLNIVDPSARTRVHRRAAIQSCRIDNGFDVGLLIVPEIVFKINLPIKEACMPCQFEDTMQFFVRISYKNARCVLVVVHKETNVKS